MSNLIGSQIDHYRLDRLIGAGGMGTVYEATDLKLQRTVALKLMHPMIANQHEFRDRLKSEAQTAAALDHPSIIKIYDFAESANGQLYVAMEYIRDGSLRDHIQRLQLRNDTLDTKLALQITIQIASALDAAHRAGVIHRDVKPGNIILKRLERPEEEGFAPFRAVLTDFGLVQVVRAERITEFGMTLGTPVYMSPEQCEGDKLDGRSDLYSLGVVLYEMLAGRPPFTFDRLSAAIRTHILNEMPPSLRDVRPDIPPIVDALLSTALAKVPDDRFRTGKEMADVLRVALTSIADMPTRILDHRSATSEAEAADLVAPPAGSQLAVRTAGGVEVDRYVLPKARMTLGRSGDNDLVLVDEAVSRYHARLEHTRGGWTIRPLPNQNGTLLNGRRLRSDLPVLIQPGEPIQIGPYEMWLDQRDTRVTPPPRVSDGLPRSSMLSTLRAPGDITAPRRATPVDETPTQLFVAGVSADEPFSLYLERQEISVTPGRRLEIRVDIVNRTAIDDEGRLTVHGLPDTWYTVDNRFMPLPANDRRTLPLEINVPAESRSRVGRHRLRIELTAQRHPQTVPGISATLDVAPFGAQTVLLDPEVVRLPGDVKLQITNLGNVATGYRIQPADGSELILIEGPDGEISIEPGNSVDVHLYLTRRRRLADLFSEAADIPYTLEVLPSHGEALTVGGVAQRPGSIVGWLPYIFLALLIGLCGAGALIALDISRGAATPTLPVIAGVASSTPTPIDLPLTLTSAALTLTPAQPGNLLDSDGDGLSDAQERLLGSDPFLADTDGDGLTDWEELFTFGTQPLLRDTDGDGIPDGEEVRLGTRPDRRDTDGDGIDDLTEIQRGTNPLIPETTPAPSAPTATATLLPPLTAAPTDPAPSATPTTEATPGATPATPESTNTPAATATTAPTLDLTAVPLPTRTDTPSAPTETPTATPTETAAPTVGPTQTLTPTAVPLPPDEPLPLLACAIVTPQIDGALNSEEWPLLIGSFWPAEAPGRIVDLFLVKDLDALYLAFEISDDLPQFGDSLRINIDVDGNGGDPDENDRRIQIGFDDTLTLQSGQGSNGDGLGWGPPIATDGIDAMIAPEPLGWSAEVRIANTVLPALGAQPRLMVQMLFVDEGIALWPEEADGNTATSWQPLDNGATCTPP